MSINDRQFDEIWNNKIKPALNEKLDTREFSKEKNFNDIRLDIKSWYNSNINEIESHFIKPKKTPDRHKVCACMYMAIVENSILKKAKGSPKDDDLANAEVAFDVSCQILLDYMANDADEDFKDFLKKTGLNFPEPRNTDSQEDYFDQTIKSLCYANARQELIPMLANIFCLLEDRYHLIYKHQSS